MLLNTIPIYFMRQQNGQLTTAMFEETPNGLKGIKKAVWSGIMAQCIPPSCLVIYIEITIHEFYIMNHKSDNIEPHLNFYVKQSLH